MAASMNKRNGDEIISEINITPMVDIILVLLIIFMVTASVIVSPAIKVDLPTASNAEDTVESTVALVMSKDGKIFLNGAETTFAGLSDFIKQETENDKELQAIISADKMVPYGELVHLIDFIKGRGIVKFALNIEQVDYEVVEEKAEYRSSIEG